MTDKKDFIKKHVSKWMADDGNHKLLWKDKAPSFNEVLDFLAEAVAEERARVRKIIKESLWDCAEHGLPKYEKTDCVECNSALEINVVLEALLSSLDKTITKKE